LNADGFIWHHSDAIQLLGKHITIARNKIQCNPQTSCCICWGTSTCAQLSERQRLDNCGAQQQQPRQGRGVDVSVTGGFGAIIQEQPFRSR
jgi:hypothetical protein